MPDVFSDVIDFEVSGLEDAVALLSRNIGEIVQSGLRNAALHVRHKMRVYPDPVPGILMQRGTPAQRRAFFAKMRENGGDWKRSGTLGKGWKWGLVGDAPIYGAIVYNEEPYAHWVQAQATQTAMFRGIWQTDEQVLAESHDFIVGSIGDELKRGFE